MANVDALVLPTLLLLLLLLLVQLAWLLELALALLLLWLEEEGLGVLGGGHCGVAGVGCRRGWLSTEPGGWERWAGEVCSRPRLSFMWLRDPMMSRSGVPGGKEGLGPCWLSTLPGGFWLYGLWLPPDKENQLCKSTDGH